MGDGFRIARIGIEGFKGFTARRDVDLRNRHVFLLGRNGNGKSSVIEAIRWGLFGSTGRPGDIVANSDYATRCRVEIGLLRDGKEWQLRRTLIRGASGGSDARLLDETGQERRISDIMPQLDSLDAGEGTHIIFAPQSTPLKRQPEDLKPFERTVYTHLGLTPARALMGHTEDFLSELRDEEETLDENVSELRKRVDGRIASLEAERSVMLTAPPWGEGIAPTMTESELKARRLVERIADAGDEAPPVGASVGALIQAAELALESRSAAQQGTLQRKLELAEARLGQLQELRDGLGQLRGEEAATTAARSELADTLDGKSVEDLRRDAEERRRQADTVALKIELAAKAIEVMRREVESQAVSCPICGQEQDRPGLESMLERRCREPREDELDGLRKAERVLGEAEGRASVVSERERIEAEQRERLASALKTIEGLSDRSIEELDDPSLEREVTTVSNQIASIEAQVNDDQEWCKEIERDLVVLRVEARYHDLQKELRDLRAIEVDFRRAADAFATLLQFGKSVREIGDAVSSALTNELKVRTPAVADSLSQVFAALTRHPHFDRLTFNEAKLPGLEMRVSSSGSPEATHPTGVLNGQAQSALDLVPYFALGGGKETPTEVYLVLLDDPTRAFDKEHIAILIERLADLGKRVQIVVASQETETFRELLPRSFDRADFVVIEPKNWSFEGGPMLDVEYE